MDIATVNAMDEAAFVAALGDVFEHSPWVAQRAYGMRVLYPAELRARIWTLCGEELLSRKWGSH